MSRFWRKPRVFISYTWHPEENKGKAFRIAENLRGMGFDVRIDVYFQQSIHGFSPPQPVDGDPRNAWVVWAENEIRQADCVLLLCTDEYTASDRNRDSYGESWINWHNLPYEQKLQTRVPFVWWDWHCMYDDWKSGKAAPSKYVPAGFGPYESNKVNIPGFLGSATYCNLEDEKDFSGMLRRLKTEHRRMNPRSGVFISYAHSDDPMWIDTLLHRLSFVERAGLKIWTDREIEPGDRWHEEIQGSLAAAKVAILLVSPNFLSSEYITGHELPNFLEAAENDGLKLFWIPIRPADYEGTEIAKIQAAHPPSKPLSKLKGPGRDAAFLGIASKVAAALEIEMPETG